MDTKKIMTRIVLRNDTAAAWEAANPVLLKGEMAAEIDTGLLKIGDGVTAYKSLSYLNEDTVGDNKTIVLDGTTLKLKNFGVEYYKWIPAKGDVAGHHEKQVVDGDHPWIAGLEPRSIENPEGGFEIAWYEPSNITVDGLEKEVTAVSAIAEANKTAIGDEATEGSILNTLTKKLDLAGGTMTGDITLKDGGKAISDTAVANLIASAGHLKREVVEQLPEVSTADPDTIYMVKDASITSGDAYKEYMLIEGALVQIGDTSVDLSGKVDKVEGKSLISDTEIDRLASMMTIKAIDEDTLAIDDNGKLSAIPYVLKAATDSALGGIYVPTANGLSVAADGKLAIAQATDASFGTVKGGEEIGIADGVITVKKISTANLYVPEGENLVLDGGGASG